MRFYLKFLTLSEIIINFFQRVNTLAEEHKEGRRKREAKRERKREKERRREAKKKLGRF